MLSYWWRCHRRGSCCSVRSDKRDVSQSLSSIHTRRLVNYMRISVHNFYNRQHLHNSVRLERQAHFFQLFDLLCIVRQTGGVEIRKKKNQQLYHVKHSARKHLSVLDTWGKNGPSLTASLMMSKRFSSISNVAIFSTIFFSRMCCLSL